MDTLTHALSGALLGRATASGAGGAVISLRRRVAVGFLAAAFPDSDALLQLFIDPLTFINLHRGVTHSLVLMPFWGLLLASVFALLLRDRADGRLNWRAYFGIALLALLIHILGDVITAYGTGIFAPLSDYRAAFPTTFIIDPWFTGILLLGLIASWFWRHSRIPSLIGLGLLVLYVGLQAVLSQEAREVGQGYVRTHGLVYAKVHALPQPLSPFNWKIIVEAGNEYHVAYVNLRRPSIPIASQDESFLAALSSAYLPVNKIVWRKVSRFGESADDKAMAREVWEAEVMEDYRDFARYPALYRIDKGGEAGTCVWFVDLRFTMEAGEMFRRAPFLFGLCGHQGQDWMLHELKDGRPVPVD